MFYNSAMYVLMRLLPVSAGSALGGWLGSRVAPRQMPVRAARAARNLDLLRPDLTLDQKRAILRQRWNNMGRFAAEMPSMDRLLTDRHFTIEDEAGYHQATSGPQPIIFVSLHIAHWDLIAYHRKTQLDRPIIGVHQLPDNPQQARMLSKARALYVDDALEKGENAARRILRHLTKVDRAQAYILLDERIDRQVSFPTLGRPIGPQGNVSIALRLAKASRAQIMPIYLIRSGGSHFTLKWHPPLDPIALGEAATFAALDDYLGRAALAHLDQWLALQDIDLADDDAAAPDV